MGVHLIGVDGELVGITVLREILKCFGRPEDDFDWERYRPGHDRSYAIDTINLRTELGWELAYTDFAAGLIEIIVWYCDNGPGDSRQRKSLRPGAPSRGGRSLWGTPHRCSQQRGDCMPCIHAQDEGSWQFCSIRLIGPGVMYLS